MDSVPSSQLTITVEYTKITYDLNVLPSVFCLGILGHLPRIEPLTYISVVQTPPTLLPSVETPRLLTINLPNFMVTNVISLMVFNPSLSLSTTQH